MADHTEWRNGLPSYRLVVPHSEVTLNQGRSVMNSKLLGALAAVALLAACADKKDTGEFDRRGRGNLGADPGQPGRPGRQRGGPRLLRLQSFDAEARRALDARSAVGLAQQISAGQRSGIRQLRRSRDRGDNLALGQRRANSSRDYLVARGVAGSRVSTISYGKDRPTALGDNEQAWAQNRNTITSVR